MSPLPVIRTAWLAAGCALLLAVGCRAPTDQPAAGPPPAGHEGSAPAQPGQAEIAIYVASNGWHSAIVIPRAALPPGVLPEAADFPRAAYLSFGWGDAAYFPAREATTGMALSAALRPTPAVIHLAGLPGHPRDVFPHDEVVELKADAQAFEALLAYLDATFERAGAERAEASAPGLHRFSRFYPATGEFHLFNTCNTWTAGGLAAAGWRVRVTGTVTAEELMAQVRPLASARN
jgi:uncharacterized protein (TIGR02117 family)